MGNVFQIKFNYKFLQLILACGLLFFLPFGGLISSYFLGGIILIELFHKAFYNSLFYRIEKFIFLILFYLLHVIALIYTDNLNDAILDLVTKLPLLVVPLFFPDFFREKKTKVILICFFLAGLLVTTLYNYYNAFDLGGRYFYYKWFSNYMHPSYYSALLLIAFAIGINYLYNNIRVSLYKIIGVVIMLLLLLITIYLVSSRFAYVASIILIIYYLFKLIRKKFYSIILFIALFFVGVFVFNSLNKNQRFKEVGTDFFAEFFKKNSANIRSEAWRKSVFVAENNLMFGVGPSDVVNEIDVKRYDEGWKKIRNYNSHNQFLESFAGLGLVGLVVLLLVFYSYVKDEKKILNISFCIIFFLFFIFESVLKRRVGVFSFSVFYILFSENSNMKNQFKFIFDKIMSFVGLIFFSPLFIVISVLIKIRMPGSVLFKQKRVGQYGKLFTVYKFRSMSANHGGSSVSVAGENRITPLGAKLRKYKLDELPGLWNVLKGEMSFVGPRPDVPGYADKLKGEDRKILELKPGITGPASLKYKNEEEILAKVEDPIKYNDEVIFPDKIKINLNYYYHNTFIGDIKLIIKTLLG